MGAHTVSDIIQTIHYNRHEDDSLSHFHPHAPSPGPVRFCDANGVCSEDWVDGTVTSVTNAPNGWLVRVVPNEDYWPDEATYVLFVEERTEDDGDVCVTSANLAEWDFDRILFYVGELEAQVSRLSKPQPEDTVTLTLSTEQAERLRSLLSDNIEWLRQDNIEACDILAERIAEIHDDLIDALPKEDEAP